MLQGLGQIKRSRVDHSVLDEEKHGYQASGYPKDLTVLETTPELEKLYGEMQANISSWSRQNKPPMLHADTVMQLNGYEKQYGNTHSECVEDAPMSCSERKGLMTIVPMRSALEMMVAQKHDSNLEKRKFSSTDDACPIVTKPRRSNQLEEDDFVMWSGPPKPPRSPIICNQKVSVSDPVYRKPRRFIKTNSAGKSRTAVKEDLSKNVDVNGSSAGGERERIIQQNPRPDESNQKSRTAAKEVQSVHMSKVNVGGDGSSAAGHVERTLRQNQKSGYTESEVQMNKTSTKVPSKKAMADQQVNGHGGQGEGMQQGRRASTHMPPRDPLCHVPIVTPPCPIRTIDAETPTEVRVYTHVSLCADRC